MKLIEEYQDKLLVGPDGQRFHEAIYNGKNYLADIQEYSVVLFSNEAISDRSVQYRDGYETIIMLYELDDLYLCKMFATYKGNVYAVGSITPRLTNLELLIRKEFENEDYDLGFKFDFCFRVADKFVDIDEIEDIHVARESIFEEFKEVAMQPLFSIIVPIYKVEKYLPACVESLMAQEFQSMEIILVNDGSPDGCPALCQKYAALDSRIKVVDKPNGGLISARKAGLAVASGAYIGFVDGDDLVGEGLYERLAEIVYEHEPDVVAMGFSFMDDATGELTSREEALPKGYYGKDRLEQEVYPVMMTNYKFFARQLGAAIWAKLIRRDLISQVLPELDEMIRDGEDAAVTYPCLVHANSLYLASDECGYCYRVLAESMSHAYDGNWVESASRYCQWMDKMLGDSQYEVIRDSLETEKFNMFYRYIAREQAQFDDKRAMKRRFSEILNQTELGKAALEVDVDRLPMSWVRKMKIKRILSCRKALH